MIRLAAMILMLSGCASTTYRVGIAHDVQAGLGDHNPLGVIQVEYEVDDRHKCGWLHLSHVFQGAPFNNKHEETLDALYCSMEFSYP